MDDIANHVLKALQKVEMVESIENRTMSDICGPESEPWEFGALLQDEILKVGYLIYTCLQKLNYS